MAGRPTKLTADRQAYICWALTLGATYNLAAAVAGITRQTLFLWVRRGKDGDRRYAGFYRAFQQALARAEIALLRKIWRAIDRGNWWAAAWLLERRWPEEFGKSTVANLELHRLRRMSDDELLAELARTADVLDAVVKPPWMRGRQSSLGVSMSSRTPLE